MLKLSVPPLPSILSTATILRNYEKANGVNYESGNFDNNPNWCLATFVFGRVRSSYSMMAEERDGSSKFIGGVI